MAHFEVIDRTFCTAIEAHNFLDVLAGGTHFLQCRIHLADTVSYEDFVELRNDVFFKNIKFGRADYIVDERVPVVFLNSPLELYFAEKHYGERNYIIQIAPHVPIEDRRLFFAMSRLYNRRIYRDGD